MTTTNNRNSKEKDVIDVDAQEQTTPKSREEDISARAPLTAAVLKGVEAARNLIHDQFKASEDTIGDLEKKAKEIVVTVQKSVDSVGDRVREEGKEAMERVREEGKEAKGRFEALRQRVGKLPIRVDLESWVNLPADAREELLSAMGVASERQIDKLQASLDALRGELSELLQAHTEAIKTELKRKPRANKGSTQRAAAKKAPKADT